MFFTFSLHHLSLLRSLLLPPLSSPPFTPLSQPSPPLPPPLPLISSLFSTPKSLLPLTACTFFPHLHAALLSSSTFSMSPSIPSSLTRPTPASSPFFSCPCSSRCPPPSVRLHPSICLPLHPPFILSSLHPFSLFLPPLFL